MHFIFTVFIYSIQHTVATASVYKDSSKIGEARFTSENTIKQKQVIFIDSKSPWILQIL